MTDQTKYHTNSFIDNTIREALKDVQKNLLREDNSNEMPPLLLIAELDEDNKVVRIDAQDVSFFHESPRAERLLEVIKIGLLQEGGASVLIHFSEAWSTINLAEPGEMTPSVKPADSPDRVDTLLVDIRTKTEHQTLAFTLDRVARTIEQRVDLPVVRII